MTEHGENRISIPLPEIEGKLRLDEPMSAHTSFKIGGPVDIMASPADVADLQILLRWAEKHSVPVFLLGAGSNLLVSDKGIRGMAIQFGAGFMQVRVQDTRVIAGAAVRLPSMVRKALGAGLSGLEGLAGIPGTVGGAVCMNAGTPIGSVKDTLESVRIADFSGNLSEVKASELGLTYRNSSVRESKLIIVEATFGLCPEGSTGIGDIVESLISKRKQTQPMGVGTAGSVFKNPHGEYAGRVLEAIGAKGMQVGGARVSSKHANFIENTGAATASDVRELITVLQRLSREKFGINLEPEIQMVGEWS